jgi:hypothetical protein
VSRDGYRATVLSIEVTAGSDRGVHPVLERESRWFESPWLWIGIGAALAAGVAAAVITTRDPHRIACIGPDEEC